jgi:hypothetical protein
MAGSTSADSSSEPSRDGDPGEGPQDPLGLAESRRHLERLVDRLNTPDENPRGNETDDPQRYWLYEHLRRLSLLAEEILEEFEGAQLELPINFANFLTQCIEPLKSVHSDLLKYYWRTGCLMERLALTEVDNALFASTREIRKDWAGLGSAISEYSVARQEPGSPQPPDTLLVTGRVFQLDFLAFVNALSGLVNRNGFKKHHSRLASSLGMTSVFSNARRRKDPRTEE